MSMVKSQEIIAAYSRIGSITGVVRSLGVSYHRVRKVLSTNGYVLNEYHERILKLHKAGASWEEIAEDVGLSAATVRSYLPGVRPTYGDELSNTTAWRKRKKGE